MRDRKDVPVEYRYYTTLSKEKCDEYVEEFKGGNNTHGHPVHMDNDILTVCVKVLNNNSKNKIVKNKNNG